MDLGKEARALLDSARRADSAPNDIRRRARQRLVSAVTAGAIGTSAAIAQGASMGSLGAATGTSATVGASLTATWVGAVVAGLSLGIVAISPTATEQPAVTTVQATPSAIPTAKAGTSSHSLPIADAPQPVEPPMPEISPQPEDSGAAARARAPQGSADSTRVQGDAPANLDVTVTSQPTKASIARETELLAEVQRALQQGRPATALAKLNRYDADFPAGALREESTASRVMALCAFGRAKDAEHWAAEFFRRYPNSPLSARVRGACRGASLN